MTATDAVNKLLEREELSCPLKKRILVLISEGGGGHKMAGESLKEIFSSDFEVEVVNIITQIIYPLDFLHSITSGVFTGEDFYNFLLRKGYHKGVHVLAKVGNRYLHANRLRIEKLFEKYLSQACVSYDLVISTVPFINSGVAKALQKRKIPFLVLPTDLDTSTFFVGMTESQFKKEDRVAFALPYDDEDLRKKGLKRGTIPSDKIVVTGFPVRGECQKRYTQEQKVLLQLKHGLQLKSRVITLVLGASGNRMIFSYAKQLSLLQEKDFSLPLEINICTGKNEKVRRAIFDWMSKEGGVVVKETSSFTSLKMPSGLIFHLRKFTKELIEIMACSDLVMTKTGSCSVNEAIYLGKKLLLDNTDKSSARYLFWETFNLHFVRKHGLGDVFYHLSEMNVLIRMLLQEDLGHPVVSGAFLAPDFQENVTKVVEDLLSFAGK